MKRDLCGRLRLRSWQAAAPLWLLLAGCSVFSPTSGCEPPPPATDARSPAPSLECRRFRCVRDDEAVRGSDPHLIVEFDCPGSSKTFLAAVKVDGALASMHEVECAGFGTLVVFDAGPWEPPDTVWHTVEVVLDPLNLFKETNESNNRGSARLRIVDGAMPTGPGLEARGGR